MTFKKGNSFDSSTSYKEQKKEWYNCLISNRIYQNGL